MLCADGFQKVEKAFHFFLSDFLAPKLPTRKLQAKLTRHTSWWGPPSPIWFLCTQVQPSCMLPGATPYSLELTPSCKNKLFFLFYFKHWTLPNTPQHHQRQQKPWSIQCSDEGNIVWCKRTIPLLHDDNKCRTTKHCTPKEAPRETLSTFWHGKQPSLPISNPLPFIDDSIWSDPGKGDKRLDKREGRGIPIEWNVHKRGKHCNNPWSVMRNKSAQNSALLPTNTNEDFHPRVGLP